MKGDARWLRMVLVLCLAMICSSCGAMVRAVAWPSDPTPLMVIFREGEPCTVIFGRTTYITRFTENFTFAHGNGDLSSAVECDSAYSPNMNASIIIYKDTVLDGSKNSDERVTRVYENLPRSLPDTDLIVTGQPYYGVIINTFKTGSSIFCDVVFQLSDARFISNVGRDKKMHILLGNATRECARTRIK